MRSQLHGENILAATIRRVVYIVLHLIAIVSTGWLTETQKSTTTLIQLMLIYLLEMGSVKFIAKRFNQQYSPDLNDNIQNVEMQYGIDGNVENTSVHSSD